MSSEAFIAAINSAALQRVVRHWLDIRRDRLLPGWNDIRPAAIRAQLSIVWSWKFDRATNEFTGRLAGERIQSVFGTNFRTAKMADVFSGHDYPRIFARHKRVLTMPEFFCGHGLVFWHLDRFDIGERIILPLADDGLNGDGIIGATDFVSNYGIPPDSVVLTGETEQWFALD